MRNALTGRRLTSIALACLMSSLGAGAWADVPKEKAMSPVVGAIEEAARVADAVARESAQCQAIRKGQVQRRGRRSKRFTRTPRRSRALGPER
jgi:hypothetical protein